MGEIKSTLDLVMERTRNLSMSPEERILQQRADFEKKLQGLLNKYDEESLSLENLTNRIKALTAELKITDRQLVAKGVLGRIDPDVDNKRWINLISVLEPAATEPVEKIIDAFRQKRTKLLEDCELQMQDRLAAQHGITGSAVIPNPSKDGDYQENITALKNEARVQIEAL